MIKVKHNKIRKRKPVASYRCFVNIKYNSKIAWHFIIWQLQKFEQARVSKIFCIWMHSSFFLCNTSLDWENVSNQWIWSIRIGIFRCAYECKSELFVVHNMFQIKQHEVDRKSFWKGSVSKDASVIFYLYVPLTSSCYAFWINASHANVAELTAWKRFEVVTKILFAQVHVG